MIDNKKYINSDKVNITCDNCGKVYITSYFYRKKGLLKYEKDLCRSCRQKEQYRLGLRKKQIETCRKNAKYQKGKTFEELYGFEKAQELKSVYSKNSSGKNNSMYGKHHKETSKLKISQFRKGKTYEDLYGKEKSDLVKSKLSDLNAGSKNKMYGKPSPQGSGNGWSGWYNSFYFRSLLELSFLTSYEDIDYLKNAEYIKIPYVDANNCSRNYLPDFINEKEKILFEIKPKNLINSIINQFKFKAGKEFCDQNDLKYQILTEDNISKISNEQIKYLHENGVILFTDRYEEKYKKEFLNECNNS